MFTVRSCVSLIRQRVPGKNVFYYKCPDHRKNYVMSFAFQFDREDDVYEVRKHKTRDLRQLHLYLVSFYILTFYPNTYGNLDENCLI